MAYCEAGVCCCRRSCGRSVLYSVRNASKFRCCAAQLPRTGLIALSVERPMHALVRAVVLRAARPASLVDDTEAHPPHVEIREAVDRLCGAGDTVVGPDGDRQPVLAERSLEHGARRHGLRGEEPAAREEEARVLIRDRQRVAVLAIARAKLSLEIGGPEVVGRRRRRAHRPRMGRRAAAATPLHQPAAREQIRHRARCWPVVDARVSCAEHAEQLPRAPERMRLPRPHEEVRHRVGDPVRAAVRRAAPIRQPAPAIGVIARKPLIADAATHAVACTELAHGEAIAQRVADELQAFLHGPRLLPWHPALAVSSSGMQVRVLPMFPDYGVTHVPGLYRLTSNER